MGSSARVNKVIIMGVASIWTARKPHGLIPHYQCIRDVVVVRGVDGHHELRGYSLTGANEMTDECACDAVILVQWVHREIVRGASIVFTADTDRTNKTAIHSSIYPIERWQSGRYTADGGVTLVKQGISFGLCVLVLL